VNKANQNGRLKPQRDGRTSGVGESARSGPLLNDLSDWQARQHKHDVAAHAQVLSWPTFRQVTHFALHFAKYQGILVNAVRNEDKKTRHRVIVDSFIIALASANTLGMKLAEWRQSPTSKSVSKHSSYGALLVAYVSTVGRIAKACEALDHSESYPSWAVLEESVTALMGVICAFAAHEGLDLSSLVARRWAEVEGKAEFELGRSTKASFSEVA
jgi:hypothetical protein